jgi:exosortase
MQDITAKGSWVALNLIGIDTERAGNILTVWNQGIEHQLNIAEACSGMRMLMAFLALGVAIAYTGFTGFWQRATLVLLGIPIALLVNILRVVTLALLTRIDTDFAAGDFHTFVGLLWLVPAFFMYLGVMWIIRNIVVEEPATGSGGASS